MSSPAKQSEGNHLPFSTGHPAEAYDGNPDELHDLFGGETSDEEDPLAALRNDPNYAALISELEYIAVEAKKIFAEAERDPSDKVWDELKIKLEAEAE